MMGHESWDATGGPSVRLTRAGSLGRLPSRSMPSYGSPSAGLPDVQKQQQHVQAWSSFQPYPTSMLANQLSLATSAAYTASYWHPHRRITQLLVRLQPARHHKLGPGGKACLP